METKQTIHRRGTFDAGHRVMNERFKCFNIHGHTYKYELVFSFNSMQSIGYAIDFKEIKRLACQWIDDVLDHGFIANPEDDDLLIACKDTKSKIWQMNLNNGEYCNPTVENIAKEIFLVCDILFSTTHSGLEIEKVILDETPNCGTLCTRQSISPEEWRNFNNRVGKSIRDYAEKKGVVEYDDRKASDEGN